MSLNFQEGSILKSADGLGYTISEEVNTTARLEAERKLRQQAEQANRKSLTEQLQERREALENERREQQQLPLPQHLEEEDAAYLETLERNMREKRRRELQEERTALNIFRVAALHAGDGDRTVDFGDSAGSSLVVEKDTTEVLPTTAAPSMPLGRINVKRRKVQTTTDSMGSTMSQIEAPAQTAPSPSTGTAAAVASATAPEAEDVTHITDATSQESAAGLGSLLGAYGDSDSDEE